MCAFDLLTFIFRILVTTMYGMFQLNTDFNKDLSGWNVGEVTDFSVSQEIRLLSPKQKQKSQLTISLYLHQC